MIFPCWWLFGWWDFSGKGQPEKPNLVFRLPLGGLFIGFGAVAVFAQHLPVVFGGFAALAPRDNMVALHLVNLKFFLAVRAGIFGYFIISLKNSRTFGYFLSNSLSNFIILGLASNFI